MGSQGLSFYISQKLFSWTEIISNYDISIHINITIQCIASPVAYNHLIKFYIVEEYPAW